MKEATTFHSTFTNSQGLLIDGVPHLSITGATKLMYGNDGGKSIERFRTSLTKMSGVSSLVAATDISLLDGICPVSFEREGAGQISGYAMTQELFTDMLWHFSEKNTAGGRRAKALLKQMTQVTLDLILRKEAGLVSKETTKEIDASIAHFFKPLPGNEKADPINKIKELLIANGQKDGCQRMGVLVNEIAYNRLPQPVYDELVKRCGGWRRASWKTNWQQLSSDAQKRFEDVLLIAKIFIEDEMENGSIFDFGPVIQKLDRVAPRYRTSGYAARIAAA